MSADKGVPPAGKEISPPGRANSVWGQVAFALTLVVLVLVLAFAVWPLLKRWTSGGGAPPTVLLLGISFAAGVLLLFLGLIAFSVIGYWIDKSGVNTRGALSLPHGSISAVLALIILVVFSVTSIHIFGEVRAGEGSGIESRGVTQEALMSLPSDRVLDIQAETVPAGAPATYQVTLSNPHEDSTAFATQLMTIFSTLLIAIVGFYFGQGATAAGIHAAGDAKTTEEKPKGGTDAGVAPAATSQPQGLRLPRRRSRGKNQQAPPPGS